MELEDLLQSEGLDADGAEGTLSWARARAEELVAGLVADSELGPLLDSAAANTAEQDDVPRPARTGGTQPSMAAVSDRPEPPAPHDPEAAEDSPPVAAAPAQEAQSPASEAPAESATPSEMDTPVEATPPDDRAQSQQDDAPSGDAVEGEATAAAPEGEATTAAPEGEPAALAPEGAPDDAAAEAPEAEAAAPNVTVAAAPTDDPVADDVTQPRVVAAVAEDAEPGVTNSGSIEIDDDEIELLDDDDLEMVIDDDDDGGSAADGGQPADEAPPADDGEVPEWQAALNSASLGGTPEADEQSGLHQMPPSKPKPDPAGTPEDA